MQECFPKHSSMGTEEWNKTKKQTKNLRRKARTERSKVGAKKEKTWQAITTKSQYNINKHNMVLLYKDIEIYNKIKLTKNKMDLNNQKMLNHPLHTPCL